MEGAVAGGSWNFFRLQPNHRPAPVPLEAMHSFEKHLFSGFCVLGLKDRGIDTAPSTLSSQSSVGGGISSDVIAQGDTMEVCTR